MAKSSFGKSFFCFVSLLVLELVCFWGNLVLNLQRRHPIFFFRISGIALHPPPKGPVAPVALQLPGVSQVKLPIKGWVYNYACGCRATLCDQALKETSMLRSAIQKYSSVNCLCLCLPWKSRTALHPHTFSLTKRMVCFTKADFVLTRDPKWPYEGQFCGKINTGRRLAVKRPGSLVRTKSALRTRGQFLSKAESVGVGAFFPLSITLPEKTMEKSILKNARNTSARSKCSSPSHSQHKCNFWRFPHFIAKMAQNMWTQVGCILMFSASL